MRRLQWACRFRIAGQIVLINYSLANLFLPQYVGELSEFDHNPPTADLAACTDARCPAKADLAAGDISYGLNFQFCQSTVIQLKAFDVFARE